MEVFVHPPLLASFAASREPLSKANGEQTLGARDSSRIPMPCLPLRTGMSALPGDPLSWSAFRHQSPS